MVNRVERMGKGYKSRHHIGSRRASEKVITYNESLWPSSGIMRMQSPDKTLASRPGKRKNSESFCNGYDKPTKTAKVCERSEDINAAKSDTKDPGKRKKQSPEVKVSMCCKCDTDIKDVNKNKIKNGGKTEKVNHVATCNLVNTKRKNPTDKKSVKRKKAKNGDDVRPPTFLRRLASLNAQAKVNVLYDSQPVKKVQSKVQFTEMETLPISDASEDDIPLAMLLGKDGKSRNGPQAGSSKFVKLKDKSKNVERARLLKKNTKTGKSECNKKPTVSKKLTNGAMKKPKVKTPPKTKKAKKVESTNDVQSFGNTKRMASLNARAILEASYDTSPPLNKVNKKQKSVDIDLNKKDNKKKTCATKTRVKTLEKECDQKTNNQSKVKKSISKDGGVAKQLDSKPDIEQVGSVDKLEALKRDLSAQNMRSNTMTTLKPLPAPKMATGQILMITQNRPLLQSDTAIQWTNLEPLEAKSIKTEILTPTPQLPTAILQQTPVSLSAAYCAQAPPIVPTSQFQSYTVGGLGSITNLPLMPRYGSAFSVPGYSSAIYQHGFYQPAGPLIQTLSDQTTGPILQAVPDGCIIQHPIAVRPIPQPHLVEKKPQISPAIIQPKSLKNTSGKTKRENVSKASTKSVKTEKSVSVKIESNKEKTKKTTDKVNKKKDNSKKVAAKNEKEKLDNVEKKKPPTSKNPWSWEGEPVLKKIPSLANEHSVERKCYPAIRHKDGDVVHVRECVLVCSGPRKTDLPYVAKIAALWENPLDNEKMMSVLWYYRPEHTEAGRQRHHGDQELFMSKHWDETSVMCIEEKGYVLTACEFARYKAELRRLEDCWPERQSVVPEPPTSYPRSNKLPPEDTDEETVFLCRSVYDFRQKRLLKNPS